MIDDSTDWMAVRGKLASILYSPAPLAERLESLRAEFRRLGPSVLSMELESMARSAYDNRENPFLDVGKDLLIYCDEQHYRALANRGETPRWIPDLRRHEQERRLREEQDDL